MAFDAATVLLAWAVGGLAFLWVTARRREVGLGYGWLLRSSFGVIALGAGLAALRWPYRITEAASGTSTASASDSINHAATTTAAIAAALVMVATAWALIGSVVHRQDRQWRRVKQASETHLLADAIPPLVGVVGLAVLALIQGFADDAGIGPTLLHVARLLIGTAFLGVVTDAMLLGHWYLVQPGMRREPLLELIAWLHRIWPLEVAALLVPVGMLSVFSGSIEDGYGGVLGWFWAACAITTIALAQVAKRALAEPQYAAVMSATGLLYLAILSGFGTDLVARLVLAA